MNKIKLDSLKNEISNYKQRIDLLQNKKRELNELIHKPSTFESDVRVYRVRENELQLELRSLADHLNVIEREANALERDLANESIANRKKEWLSITPDKLDDLMSSVINDINEVSKKRDQLNYQVNFFVDKRNKVLAVINSVEVLQDELKALRTQKAVSKVNETTGEKTHNLNKAYEQKSNELNLVKEEAIDAAEELTELTTQIDSLKLRLSHLYQDRKDLEASYYLQRHHKAELVYISQVDSLMASLRHMRAIETLIPQYRQPDISPRLLSRLKSGLEIPTFEGLTESPHELNFLFKDLDKEVNDVRVELVDKLECEL